MKNKNDFNKLQLNKRTIAKLDDAQLISIKGGKQGGNVADDTIVVICQNGGTTIVNG